MTPPGVSRNTSLNYAGMPFFHISNISCIRQGLSIDSTKTFVRMLATSRVDYCKALLSMAYLTQQPKHLQAKVWSCHTITCYTGSPSVSVLFVNQLLAEVFVISGTIKVKVRVINQSRRLRLTTPTETLIILDIRKTESNNFFSIHWLALLVSWRHVAMMMMMMIIHWTKQNVFTSSLTASNTKGVMITGDLKCPWDDNWWRHVHWFRNFTVRFRPIRKELESSMYDKRSYCTP